MVSITLNLINQIIGTYMNCTRTSDSINLLFFKNVGAHEMNFYVFGVKC